MSSGRLVPLSELFARAYGPAQFWRDLGDLFRDVRESGRAYLSYDEWRVILRHARDAGLLGVYATAKGEPLAQFTSPLGPALLRLFRVLRSANARGLSAEEFQTEFNAQVDRDRAVIQRAMDARDESRRAAAQKTPERTGARRRRQSGTETDEHEIREVRAGYTATQ